MRPRTPRWRSSLARPGCVPASCGLALFAARSRDVEHLFAVTGGLDSMIVGEAEIQGQVKRAYEMALVEGVSGPVSNRLFRDALAAGKRVRSETGIARSNVSVSTVAVALAGDFLGSLAERRVLVIGAGENAELTARALRDRGVEAFFVANRRHDRALELAQRFGGRAIAFDDLPSELENADIVVSSTGAPHQILGRQELEFVAASRMGRPLVLIDLAVPRDIEPSVRDCPGIALYDMDDLRKRSLASRPACRRGARGVRSAPGGGRSLRALALLARRAADHRRAAPPGRRRGRSGAPRERGSLGVAVRDRPQASRGDGPRRGLPAAARAHAAAQGRDRRRLVLPPRAYLRELFGWRLRSRPATKHPPPRSPASTRAARTWRDPLGSRGSALALARPARSPSG